jgi:hypothetical protein
VVSERCLCILFTGNDWPFFVLHSAADLILHPSQMFQTREDVGRGRYVLQGGSEVGRQCNSISENRKGLTRIIQKQYSIKVISIQTITFKSCSLFWPHIL